MENESLRLDGQIIERVSFHSFRARYPRLHGKNARLSYHGFGGEVMIARITTRQGASGWGQLSTSLEDAMAAVSLLEGKALTAVFDPNEGILNPALQAFDIPLHDLAGVILNLPVSKMISKTAVEQVPVYDGAIYMNDIIPEDKPFGMNKVLAECQADYALGYRMLKVKIGRGGMWMPHDEGLARDIELVNAIHKLLPDAGLMVDANDAYSVEDAIRFLEGIGNVPLYWFEEPFRESPESNRQLKAYLAQNRPQTLIADGESMTDIPLLYELAEKKLLDVWQPDVCGYGFTAWRKLMKELSPRGYLASPHAWGTVV
ncbi:MAG: enolase C-terminal domain-like protein, partial [Clostridia bacterium]